MKEYPLHKAFMLIEPGPVIFVTSAGDDHPNIMTLTWTMVLDWTPRFALCTGAWNYTFRSMMYTKECVLSVPTADISKKVTEIGTCSSEDINKFEKFHLTPIKASSVKAPLVKECYANLECKVIDYIERHNIVILECIKAHIDSKTHHPKFLHAVGDGRFTVDGETIDLRDTMTNKLPPGV